jgi:hypothetical protein
MIVRVVWGSRGNGNGQFWRQFGIACGDGSGVYVPHRHRRTPGTDPRHRVQVFVPGRSDAGDVYTCHGGRGVAQGTATEVSLIANWDRLRA